MERYDEDKVTEETKNLKQLDRIEFRQKRIYNLSLVQKEHIDFGLTIIMSMIYFTLATILYSIDSLFIFFIVLSSIVCASGIYNYIKETNEIKSAREHLYEEYFNIKKIK